MKDTSSTATSSKILDLLTEKFAPRQVQRGTDEAFRAKVVVLFSLALGVWGPVYAAIMYALSGEWGGPIAVMICAGLVVSTLFMLRKGASFLTLGNWLALNVYWLMVYVAVVSDFGSPPFLWLAVVPMLAVLIAGVRSGLFWLVAALVAASVYYSTIFQGETGASVLAERQQVIFEMSVLLGLYVLVLLLTLAYESLKEWAIREVRAGEAHSEAVLETAGDGILTLDDEGRIQQINRVAEAVFGYDRDQILGAHFATLVPNIERGPDAVEDASQSGAPADGDLAEWQGTMHQAQGVRRGGESFPLEMSLQRVVLDDFDRDASYVVVLRDITDRKKNEAALEEARDAAVAANEAKSSFLANMSHELRTPLNAIIGYSELITEDLEASGRDDFLPDIRKIRVAGKHLLSLINDILDLSKIEAGKMELYLETVELKSFLGDVISTIEPVVEKKGNTFKVDIDDAPDRMLTDHTKLRQILFNLLSNASKFTEDASVRLHVYAERERGKEYCVFEVIDRGIGIPQDKLERLFEAFTQADETTTRRFGGTGLGLTITSHFVEMMGGSISVTSEVGEGSTFRVRLPLASASAVSDELDFEEGADVEEANAALLADPSAPTVLVIDDDPTVHGLMKRFLNREGYAIHTATDGAEGLQRARELAPSVITLDVMMPELDGWSVLARLKGDEATADIPVVMLTIVSNKNMGYTLGASEYLIKPVDRKRLTSVLSHFSEGDDDGRVLIVEDDDQTRELLSRSVSRQGWEVDAVEHGAKALEFLETHARPDVVLLDLMMPEMDGFEVLEHLQKRPEWEDLPVIVVTAAELTQSESEYLQARVSDVLGKGEYTQEQIVASVRQAARESRQMAQETS